MKLMKKRIWTKAPESAPARKKIIIDTDTAGDDASALILAAKSPEVEILGVTVLAGNVELEQATKNALAALEIAGCNAPVYKGSDTRYNGEAIEAHSVYGKDGMGDKDLIHPVGQAQEGDAIDFIIDTVKANPDEIEIVMTGPATNIAKAMDRNPEAMRRVKHIWSMGSSGIYGPGNASPVAEFNVYIDAPAYDRMLNFGVPVTVIGLDVCSGDSLWTDSHFTKLAASGKIGRFVTYSFFKLREHFARNGSAGVIDNCDGMAMMCAVCPGFVKKTIQCHCNGVTDPGETYGQVIFYQRGYTYDLTSGDYDYNVEVVSDVDRAKFFAEYLSRVGNQSIYKR